MSIDLQKIAEKRVYDIIFELENELNINTGRLPEVYHIDKNFNFNEIGYPFEIKGYKKLQAFSIIEENIIFTKTISKKTLGEEAGHFIHQNFIRNKNNILDDFGGRSIGEMIGFFSSKLIDNNRVSNYKSDFLATEKDVEDIIDAIKYCRDSGEYENLIHQQGYILGDILYDSYISKKISKKNIVNIIKSPLNKEFEAFSKFLELKYETLKRDKF